MTSGPSQALQQRLARTCWRGIRLSHPAEWEPAILSGLKEPGRCVLVDRRFQRMEVKWKPLARTPDLRQMYERLGKGRKTRPVRELTGAAGWTGLVCSQDRGHLVYAGKHFQQTGCLVEVVLAWPDGRDRQLERTILEAVAVAGQNDPVVWEALGLKALVPAAFELVSAKHLVGRLTWEFRRPKRPRAGLSIERIAMTRYWLKASLSEWMAQQQPKGFGIIRSGPVFCGGHDGTEVVAGRGGLLSSAVGRAEHRLDRAWQCPAQGRIFRLAYQQRSGSEVDWPAGLEVHCCRAVKLIPGGP